MNVRSQPPSVALLKAQDYGEWKLIRDRGEAAGSLGPYSADILRDHGFEVRHSDAQFQRPWSRRLVARGLDHLGRRRPELLGVRNALANRALMRGSDITLGIFEDQGSFASFARGHRLPALAPRKMALMVCWMAEWAQHADERTIGRYRRVLAGADLVVFFSRNQSDVFERILDVDPARQLAVPFGIDASFFAADRPREEGYVLAVGGDVSREHELLVEAVRGTGIPTRIYAPRLAAPELPENVTWVSEVIEHVRYREVLAGARLVVIPTSAPRYPGGQTVALEAMASSKAVIATGSEAMGEYVEDGVTGLLVPRGDAGALRRAIERLHGDEALRDSLGGAGRRSVEQSFTQREMWRRIAPRLHRLLEE